MGPPVLAGRSLCLKSHKLYKYLQIYVHTYMVSPANLIKWMILIGQGCNMGVILGPGAIETISIGHDNDQNKFDRI